MFADCIQYTIFNSAVSYKCGMLSFAGGIIALLLVPTVIFAVLGELLLACAIAFKEKHPSRFAYAAGQAVNNVIFGIYVCCFMTFQSKGLSWLGYRSHFLENKSGTDCKIYRFFYGVILTCMANMSFTDTYERATTIRCKCYASLTKPNYTHTLIVIVISSVVLSSPIYLVSGHWEIDGRTICSGDPGWSQLTVTILATHDVAFVCGLMQSLGTLFLIFSMIQDLGKMSNTTDFLQTAGPPDEVRTYTIDIAKLLRMAQRDCWTSIVYNGIASVIACFRSICRANFYYATLRDFEDNHTPAGVVEVYAFDAAEDITKLMTITLAGFHCWIYFYDIPSMQLWGTGVRSEESRNIWVQGHSPENPTSMSFTMAFDQCVHQAKKSNDSAYERLSTLK